MRILCCDDDKASLEVIRRSILQLHPNDEVILFQDPLELLFDARSHHADVIFMDVRMPSMTGTELARRLKAMDPLTDLVFATAFNSYGMQTCLQAFDIGVSDYILKPITPEKVQHAFDNLRHPIRKPSEPHKISIRCFGTFEIFSNGTPVAFGRSKSKEMLAYLTTRAGSSSTKKDIMAAIFGKMDSPYYGVVKKEMMDTLDALGAKDIIVNHHNQVAIARDLVDCDFYDWLDGKSSGVNAYHGIFMDQYEWAQDFAKTVLKS